MHTFITRTRQTCISIGIDDSLGACGSSSLHISSKVGQECGVFLGLLRPQLLVPLVLFTAAMPSDGAQYHRDLLLTWLAPQLPYRIDEAFVFDSYWNGHQAGVSYLVENIIESGIDWNIRFTQAARLVEGLVAILDGRSLGLLARAVGVLLLGLLHDIQEGD